MSFTTIIVERKTRRRMESIHSNWLKQFAYLRSETTIKLLLHCCALHSIFNELQSKKRRRRRRRNKTEEMKYDCFHNVPLTLPICHCIYAFQLVAIVSLLLLFLLSSFIFLFSLQHKKSEHRKHRLLNHMYRIRINIYGNT